jgi:CRP/FNR family transcriptional regulator, cyclic AMP receptor protein
MRRAHPPSEILDELRAVPLFARCSDAELRVVDALVSMVEVEPGHVLVRHGDYGQDAIIIVRGEAEVSINGYVLTTVEAGELVGELSALDPSAPRSASVVATTPMRLLILGPGALHDLLDIPTIKRDVLRTLVTRLRDADHALVR